MNNLTSHDNTIFQFSDPRQKRIYTRLQLLGPGPASFYYDACRLMTLEPQLKSTTHIVSHLLREIESAFRAVVVSASGKVVNVKSQAKHRESIEIVLNFLEIPINGPVGSLWLSLPDENYGLHARAHRDALAYRPSSPEFLGFWENMEKILDAMLQSFEERYLSAHQLIEQLLSVVNPTEDDVKKLRNNIPNSPSVLRVFFNGVDIGWLEALKPHFFKLPLGVDPITNSFSPWPESRFLVRAVTSNPSSVLEIALQIPDTNNPFVLDDLCDIALELPIEMATGFLAKMKIWLASPNQRLLPIKIAQFIQRLAENHKIKEAVELSRGLLAILPVDESSSSGWYTVHAKYVPFVYREMLEDNVGCLASEAPIEFIELLSGLLNDAICSLLKVSENVTENDPSQWWSILSERHIDNIEDTLINTLTTTSINALTLDSNNLLNIVRIYENYPWSIFHRLSLYLLAKDPTTAQSLIPAYLGNHKFFEEYPSEYYLLLQNGFNQLSSLQQSEVLEWFNHPPDDNPQRWQLHWLRAIKDYLPTGWQTIYQELIITHGEPQPFVYQSPMVSTWWGDASPITADELLSMDVSEIIEYIGNWQPSDDFLATESKHGLAIQLKSAIVNSPHRFSLQATQFLVVPPVYIVNLLSGFREACSAKTVFAWPPVLELCLGIIEVQLKDFSTNVADDLGWTRAEIADLLRAGFEKDAIDYEYRQIAWSILVILLNLSPKPEDEYKNTAHNFSSFELSYNTFRGRALHAVMQYLFWVQRQLRKLSNEPTQFNMSFDMVPEVKELLEEYMLDSSLVVKAIFGRYLPWLDLHDPNWLQEQLNSIFVDDNVLWYAAWSAYVTTCNPYDRNFNILHNQYLRAIQAIPNQESDTRTRSSTHYLEQLIWHVVTYYERGLLDLNEPEGLLQLFYQVATDNLCAYALQNIGQGLKNATEEISNDIMGRLETLWKNRLEHMQLAPHLHSSELLAFSWWFVSDKLNPIWSIEQLKQVLSLTPDLTLVLTEGIISQLDNLVGQIPFEAVKCLSIVVERAIVSEPWLVDTMNTEISHILATALKTTDTDAQQQAKIFINKRAAQGYLQFNNLLKTDNP